MHQTKHVFCDYCGKYRNELAVYDGKCLVCRVESNEQNLWYANQCESKTFESDHGDHVCIKPIVDGKLVHDSACAYVYFNRPSIVVLLYSADHDLPQQTRVFELTQENLAMRYAHRQVFESHFTADN